MPGPFGNCWHMSPFVGNVATWVEWKTRTNVAQSGDGALQCTVNGTADSASNEAFVTDPVNVGVEGVDNARIYQGARFRLRPVTTPTAERKIFTWFRSDGVSVGGWITIIKNGSAADLKLYDKDGNLLGTATGLTDGQAGLTSIFLKLGWDGTNGTIQLRVGTAGTVVGSTNRSYDPRSPSTVFSGWKLGFYVKGEASSSATLYFGDWDYYGDTPGFIPDGAVYGPVRASGAGTPQNWTVTSGTHHAAIDDPIDAPTDTDYIQDINNQLNTDDYFTHSEAVSSGTTERVSAMLHMIRCEESVNGAGAIQLIIDTANDPAWVSSNSWQPVGSGFTWYPSNAKEAITVTERPSGGLAWNDGEFNTMEYGYQADNFGGANYNQRISTAFFYYDRFILNEVKVAVMSCVADEAWPIGIGSKDAYVAQGTPDTNYGSATDMRVGYDSAKGGAQEMRSFIENGFAVGDPAPNVIDKVELNLWILVLLGSNSIDFKRISGTWTEGTMTWNTGQPALGTPEILGVGWPSATSRWWKADLKSIYQDAYQNRQGVVKFRLSAQTLADVRYITAQTREASGTHRQAVIIVAYTFPGASLVIPRRTNALLRM